MSLLSFPAITGLPNDIGTNEDDTIYLIYELNQKVNNYTAPSEYLNLTHEIEINITYTPLMDWIVNAIYKLNIYNPIDNYIHYEEFKMKYKFRDDTKLIYESESTNINVDFDSLFSLIASQTDISIGAHERFRLENVLLLSIPPNRSESLEYTQDRVINLDGNEYTTREFDGNITEITDCG